MVHGEVDLGTKHLPPSKSARVFSLQNGKNSWLTAELGISDDFWAPDFDLRHTSQGKLCVRDLVIPSSSRNWRAYSPWVLSRCQHVSTDLHCGLFIDGNPIVSSHGGHKSDPWPYLAPPNLCPRIAAVRGSTRPAQDDQVNPSQ